jgi:uncharacterized protein involved in type VI secretion and phage assembly
MSPDTINIIRAVVRDELRGFRTAELGVVKAVYPHSSGSDANNYQCDVQLRDSSLELKRVIVSTPRIGTVAIPDVGNLVLVQFLHGALDTAVITGCLYNDSDRPPQAAEREAVYVSPHSDEQGVRRVYLELPHGNSLLLDDDKLELVMGSTTLTVNHDGDVVIDAGGAVNISAGGDTKIEAQGDISLKTSAGDVTIEGINVSVKAQAQATVEGTATATLKGASVTVAGMTQFSMA